MAAAADSLGTAAVAASAKGARGLVAALSLGQLISWGTLFYGITFLAAPIVRDQGWSSESVFGAFSLALLVAGMVSLCAAKLFERFGARVVLSSGSAVAALAFLVLATAQGAWTFGLGWSLAGAAMAVVLYEGAFLALRERSDLNFRSAAATLTVVGGLASTVFWPLSRALESALGWRLTLAVFALLHLAVVAPLHRWVLAPSRRTPVRPPTSPPDQGAAMAGTTTDAARIGWLAASFALTSFVSGGLAAHLDGFFRGLGAGPGWIVAAAIAFGPLQVAGRMLDLATRGRGRWQALGSGVMAIELVALVTLFALPSWAFAAIVFAALFGAANGLLTLVRPLAVGDQGAGFASGLLAIAAASLAARALAPVTVARALGWLGPHGVLTLFLALTLLAWLAWLRAVREPR